MEILVDHGSTDVQDWRVEQLWYNGDGPSSSLEGNTVACKGCSFSFQLPPSSGLLLLNVRFWNEPIAYEVSVQTAMAVHRESTPAGDLTKTMDPGWGMGSVTHELAPASTAQRQPPS
ncbi:Amiloride-sensitive amine oxidase [copper-containing] [Lemmus lemmus]